MSVLALPPKAFLIVGLLLSSSEAWGQAGETAPRSSPTVDDGWSYQVSPAYRSPERELREQRIRSTRQRGPVDVLSLSMGGALLCFSVFAIWRRRKNARVAEAAEASTDLPLARVIPPRGSDQDSP